MAWANWDHAEQEWAQAWAAYYLEGRELRRVKLGLCGAETAVVAGRRMARVAPVLGGSGNNAHELVRRRPLRDRKSLETRKLRATAEVQGELPAI
jgi:hypothetical protein